MTMTQTRLRRCGRRLLIALWLKGNGTHRPWLHEADLAELVGSQPPAPTEEELDHVLRMFLEPATGPILERTGSDKVRGLRLRLTEAGARVARDYHERLQAQLARQAEQQ